MRELPPRLRLESVLDGALAHRLTVLSADAGFGKTTLLTSWSAGINAVVYRLTDRDRDLTQLWRQLLEVLRRHLSDLPAVPPEGGGGVAPEVWASGAEAPRGPSSAHTDSVRPQAMAELLGHSLEQRLTRDLVLVLDDAHRVTAGPAASLLAGLVRHAPPLLHVVLATRGPLPVPVRRLRAQGQVLELSGAELAFTTAEVAALLAEAAGGAGAEAAGGAGAEGAGGAGPAGGAGAGLAEQVRLTTGGWPIAVRLVVEALRDVDPPDRARRLAGLAGPRGQLTDLIQAAYQQEPVPVRRMLAIGTLFDRFTVGLCEALGVANAAELVTGLARRGLFVEPALGGDGEPAVPQGPGTELAADRDWYRLHPLAHRFITERAALPAGQAAGWYVAAARWFTDHGLAHTALRSLLAAGDHERVAGLLAEAGEQLATGGHSDAVIDAVGSLPPERRGPAVEQLAGHAYLFRGEWDEALARYTRAAGGQQRLPAGLAWRIGLIHYLRGDHEAALATYQRAGVGTGGGGGRDVALVLAWAAAAHWILGDPKTCGELAARALRTATEVDDPAALAAAHTVLSMLAAMEGDRRANAAHYAKALQYAQRAGDVLQMIRIHTNRASHSLEEGTHAAAMTELDLAVRLADLYGYGAFGGVALTNRAQIRLRLGQLEEAHHDAETALAIFDELGSRKSAYPLTQLGHLHHLRGDESASARAYEQALGHIAQSGDRQAEVPALAGLARLLADSDPARAESLAEQAVASGDGLGYVEALLAVARVALVRGQPVAARQRAQEARAIAEARRDRAGVAEAEELEAAATADPAQARALARRATARWVELGDPIGQARSELVLADRLDDPAARGAAIEAARTRLGTIGCRLLAARTDALLARAEAVAPARPVRVETLGTFRLVRSGGPGEVGGGVVLPPAGWRSRKARDVLKILLARRGRPVTREFLMEALWPGEAPAPLANRLHVAISTLRSVLDPDRERPGDAFVVTDDDTVRIRLDQLDVDLESFLDDASTGLALLRAGRGSEALPRLVRAESRYGGDFLEEDLYQDWATPLREQARAAYIAVAGRLAEHTAVAGDTDAATRYLLRILEHDPYDEQAHLRLVSTLAAAGRHGDARRHYRHYCARMDELEIESAPFPARQPALRSPGRRA